ncbi:MAG TPA: hypothetical protein VMW24_27275 [Sedimentisphaerales bacterium]|nr:hypothetical protein [Sedimentisphaerales bacterium]
MINPIHIPAELMQRERRADFIAWIANIPIDLHSRLHWYFWWLDVWHLSYTADEIDSLRVKEPAVVDTTAE